MDSVKNRGRNKFSACFNPTVVDEDEPCVHSAFPPPPSSSAGESRRRKKTAHHSLFYFVKAVFFKTPLLKKLRSKRSKRDSYNISSKHKKLTKKNKNPSGKKNSDPEEIHFQDNSDRSSLFSSTSSFRASSISSDASSGSERMKASSDCVDWNQTSANIRQHAMKLVVSSSKRDCRGLMFIILVCLAALIFWGKAFAIATCTSAWLCLAPGRARSRGGVMRANNIVGTEEYKKRVIMEGLLERNIRSKVVVQ